MRDDNKSTNFLLAYGGGPFTLAARTKKKLEEAKEIMYLHSQKFPLIWSYLEKSGKAAQALKKSFDMFKRRRLFPTPTWDRAKEKARDDREEKLRYEPEVAENNIKNFTILHKRKPTKEELWPLEHRQPSQNEISNAFAALHSSIERQGKNHSIQGTNASLIKLAMGSGFDKYGNPYLWHLFPQYKAKLIKMVHDELVVQAPKRYAQTVAGLIGDAFKRAAATKMKKVTMEFDFSIASYWKK
jgi:DNA polymerase I-like protein with 3'-5' exonuclease and polymerase domains